VPIPPLRIVVVSNLCPPDYEGGLEMSAFQLAGALRDRDHDVQLVTSEFRPTYKGPKNDPPWVHRILHYVERGESGPQKFMRFLAAMPESLKNAERMEAFLKDRTVDLGYLFGLHRIGLATHVPMVGRGIPILWHSGDLFLPRQLEIWPRRVPPYRWLLNTVYKRARSLELRGDYRNIAFVSANLRDHYLKAGLRPERTFIIPRGIDFTLAKDVERERAVPPVIFMAGRVEEHKGYTVALDALIDLHERQPSLSWELHIAGYTWPGYLSRLQEQARDGGIGPRVKFLGMLGRQETLSAMRSATVFLNASIWEEPFGRTNIEAMACGTPLIASDTGAIKEIVEESGAAILYSREDAKALSSVLERALTASDVRKDLARRGIDRVERAYTMEKILEQTEQAFQAVLAGSSKEQLCASV
jgi:glycosyltransferase involved in cell wall biosynthesis